LDIYLRELSQLRTRTRATAGTDASQVELTTLSLREFIAMALLAHHCKTPARADGFLQTEPISPSTSSVPDTPDTPGTAPATMFKIIIQGGICLQGIILIAHNDEFPSRGDIRKRNNKTCVFGCVENVTVDGQERMVRQHLSSQT
jgi:hypothetical protein